MSPKSRLELVPERVFRQPTVNGFGRELGSKGLAMLIRSGKHGNPGKTARAVHPCAISAASVSTPLLGGLLLLIGP
jgi:hypothetical protein